MTTEYNKIHALAQARRKVIGVFGTALQSFWPLADDSLFIRDLMRRKPLFAKDVTVQEPGVLDYGVKIGSSGHIADVVDDLGYPHELSSHYEPPPYSSTERTVNTTVNIMIPMPAGVWGGIAVWRHDTSYWHNVDIRLYVANRDIGPGSVPSEAFFDSGWIEMYGQEYAKVVYNFPYMLLASEGQYAVYLVANSTNSINLREADEDVGLEKYSYWSGAWVEDDKQPCARFLGADAATWSGYNKLTLAAWVNADASPQDGTIVAISDSSEPRAQIYLDDKKVKALVKNTNGDSYTIADTLQLHPGFAFVMLTYEKNVKVKLYVNGAKVDEADVNDYGLFGTAQALGIGATVKTDKTVSQRLGGAAVDDIILVKDDVPTDIEAREMYLSYLTAAPLMLMEEQKLEVTESSGEATGTGTQQAIAHGLGGVPTRVFVGNVDDGANPYVSQGADAVNIYITAVNTKKYWWQAKA